MIKERYVLKQPFRNMFGKLLETIIVFLIGMIIVKGNKTLAKSLEDEIYNNSFSFTKMNTISKKYLGSLLPSVVETTKEVFNENLNYQKIEEIENGIKLTINNNTPITVLENGMVMYIDDDSLTIEQIDGVKVTYNNILHKELKLYDYLEKGDILGTSKSNEITILFTKEGESVDYKKYF